MADGTDGSTPSGPGPSGPPSGPLSDPPPRRPAKKWTLLAVLLGGIGLVVGVVGILMGAGAFDSGARGTGESAGAATLPPSAPRSAGPTTPPASTAPSAGDGPHAFGEPQKYADGIELTVSAPKTFSPSQGASGHKAGNRAVIVDVAVRNGTDKRLDLGTVVVRGRDAEGRELASVVDAGPPPVLGLQGSLLSGRKAVAAYGFDLPAGSANELDMEVSIGFDGRTSAFWSGPIPGA
ncbi:hypothetical protein AB0K23_28705 [Streptomyces sp. NPDC049602]|uniref:hypothetical protein n=1 Tax=Streptomyces sp. NPDC049602 TaxID=3155504 RepID=UPI00341E4D05